MKSLVSSDNEFHSAKTFIPFAGKRKVWYSIAVVVALGSATFLGTVGLTPGIDFRDGSEITTTGLSSPSERPTNEVLSKNGPAVGFPMTTMKPSSVRMQASELNKQRLGSLVGQLATAYKTDAFDVLATTVGPTWSSDVTKKMVRGLVLFFIFVGLLIWTYFRTWKMATAALLVLCHDIVVTVGIYALSGLEVTPAMIIGMLAILDHSLYDTVVVFDKIRENTRDFESQSRSIYAELTGLVVNQTFIRSISTSVVGMLPMASLLFIDAFILGVGTLRDIILTPFIGIVVGTLSSIFLATLFLVDLRSRETHTKEQAAKIAAARQHRRDEVGDNAKELAKIDAAPTASPVTPGHHLGTAVQPKRKKERK